ncbi:MAG TPA: carboxypeptidase regulatory-like domain-containing protein [Bryobacteraceae bacterium]|nr:carboxypeptidase regulatory-like domain-containing protein [Bryobacteraceae bacterium]
MSCNRSKFALTVLLLLLFAAPNRAQLSNSTQVNGTITDASGAVVPDATITALNTDTQVQTPTHSNADGTFVLTGLTPGAYTIMVVKQGFQSFKESSLVLHPATVTTVNATLVLGQVGTEVSVVATAAQVQTTTAEVSNLVSQEQIGTLPLNGRNFQSLAALMPGVVNQSAGSALGTGGYATSNVMAVNGLGTNTTFYAIDGIWNENTGNMNQISITPNPDSLSEVRVLQNNYSAKYSLMGASVVLLQTKSGTSSFHGTAFEYFRNDDLNARNFFSPSVPTLKQNIFGYTIGGPVLVPFYHGQKKTFFFVSEQWVNAHTGSVLRGLTPTADQRNGLFTTSIKDPSTGQPFSKNAAGVYQIPISRVNPNSLAFLNALYPLPNAPGAALNYLNLTPSTLTQRDDEFKVDHNINERFRLTAEYFDEKQLAHLSSVPDSSSPFTTNRRQDVTWDQVAQLQFTAVISPAMVNSANIAMNRYTVNHPVDGLVYVNQIPGFNATLPFNGVLSNRIPLVTLSQGWAPQGIPAALPRNASDLDDTASDDWSWLHGKHFFQAGGSLVFNTKRQIPSTASNGQWTFTGTFTGNAMADFLLGDAATFTQISTTIRPYIHATMVSPYVEDRIQLTKRLTVTVGSRISFMPLPHPQTGFEAIFDPTKYNRANAPIVNNNGTLTATPTYDPANGMVINGVNGVPNNWSTSHQWYFAPMAGFAWDLFGNGKTSLRGGYGVTYTRIFTGQDCSYNCAVNPPIIQSVNLVNPAFPSPGGTGSTKISAPTISNADLNIQATQVQSYSLSLEHEFLGNWIVSVAGAGTLGRHLLASWNTNQPLPFGQYNFNPVINGGSVFQYIYSPYYGYGPINTLNTIVNSNWTALEASARHPMGKNLFLQLAYTWSHGLSNASAVNIYNPGQYYGSTATNVPQVFTASAIYSIPWLRTARGWKGAALGGWQVSTIATARDGYSLTPALSVPQQGLGARPDLTGAAIGGPQNASQWFNTQAFTAPAPGYFGNAGTGSIRGPGLINFDFTLYKTFKLTENQKVEFRAELFNVLNHTNFTTVSTTYGSATYGQVTAAADPRIAEFVLRYQF